MCLNSNCTVQPEYSNSNSSDPAAGVGSHETGGDASPQFIAVMTLAAILLLIGQYDARTSNIGLLLSSPSLSLSFLCYQSWRLAATDAKTLLFIQVSSRS